VDLDTDSSITYRLVTGDLDKFSVDPETGAVRTIRGLDYEREMHHELVIGTEEGRMLGELVLQQSCRSLNALPKHLPKGPSTRAILHTNRRTIRCTISCQRLPASNSLIFLIEMCKQTFVMGDRKIIESLLCLRTNCARNRTAIRTQIRTRVWLFLNASFLTRFSALVRGRLHVSDSAYELPYDSVHNLHIEGISFQFSIIYPFCKRISGKNQSQIKLQTTVDRKSYEESYGDL
jgi:hypothetical protein